MGAFAGAAQVIGDRMWGEHVLDLQSQYQNNSAAAEMFQKKADDPNTLPEFRDKYMQAALQYRLAPPGKKIKHDQFSQLMVQEERAKLMQANQGGRAAPQNGVTPPPGAQGAAPNGQGGPTQPPFPSGATSAPQGPPAQPAPPPPASTGGDDPQEMANQAIQAQQAQATAPPPVSGLPSPGFAGAQAPPAPIAPPPGVSAPPIGMELFGRPGTVPTKAELAIINETIKNRQKEEDEQQAEMRRMTQVSKFNVDQEKQRAKEDVQALKDAGIWDQLDPLVKSEISTRVKGLTRPMRPQFAPGTTPGSKAPPGTVDVFGNPVVESSEYRIRSSPTGAEWFPAIAQTKQVVMPSKNSDTGWSFVQIDRQGHRIGEVPGAPPNPAFLEHVENGVHYSVQTIDLGDGNGPQLVKIPMESHNVRGVKVPGVNGAAPMSAPPGAAPATSRATTPKPSASAGQPSIPGLPRGSTILGHKGLPSAEEKRVSNANSTIDTTEKAVNEIRDVVQRYPELIGPNSARALQLWETKRGTLPPEVIKAMTTLASIAALQPNQHSFRSQESVRDFRRNTGIDLSTHDIADSKAWLISPESAIAGIRAIADFNDVLKQNIYEAHGMKAPERKARFTAPPEEKNKIEKWKRDANGNIVKE